MPSGAKKRKAAKKHKQKVASTSSNSHTSLGDEDLKHRENEGEEKILSVDGNESVGNVKNGSEEVEKRVGENEGVVQIEGKSKSDDESDNKGDSSSDGSSGSSSSSDSDDESPPVEKDIEVIDSAPVVDVVEPIDSVSEEPTHTSPDLVEEAVSESEAGKVSVLDQEVPVESSDAVDNSLVSDAIDPVVSEVDDSLISEAIETVVDENAERKSSSVEEVVKDSSPELNKDEASNHVAASDAKESAACASEDKVVLSYPIKDGENAKEVVGSSDLQPLIALPPRPVQTTSWKGCCGLFEAFTGSNR